MMMLMLLMVLLRRRMSQDLQLSLKTTVTTSTVIVKDPFLTSCCVLPVLVADRGQTSTLALRAAGSFARSGKVGRADLVYKIIPNLYLPNTSSGIRQVFDTWNHEKSIEKLPSRAGSAPNNNPEPSAPRRERLAV